MIKTIDLNADLGEECGDDAALMAVISSANIACGGHAGDDETMSEALTLAQSHGVSAGAHPSYPDREGFGRRKMDISLEDLRRSLTNQVSQLAEIARKSSLSMTHIKPHGALYHDAAADLDLARTLAEICLDHTSGKLLVGPPVGAMVQAAAEIGVRYMAEGFVDRSYTDDGKLMARNEAGAVLEELTVKCAQAVSLALDATVMTRSGKMIDLPVQTICLHGDHPGAADAGVAVRQALEEAGVTVKAMGQ
ncbi:MAG: 5-oxoprolinase subunit PxpA [Pseudomonadota bacterium]